MIHDPSPLYFIDGPGAVKVMKELLLQHNWHELTRYYDLTGTNLKREALISGEYFYREKLPEESHPLDFRRFKHPFSPEFAYDGEYTLENNTIVIRVKIEIDQGAGMVQVGYDCFGMRKTDSGYQMIPGSFPIFPEPPITL